MPRTIKMRPCPKCGDYKSLEIDGPPMLVEGPRRVVCPCGYHGPSASMACLAREAHNRAARAADTWVEDAAIRLLELGFKTHKIATMLEVKPSSVHWIALKAGLVRAPIDNKRWSKEQDRFIVRRRKAGENYRQIAKAFGTKFGRAIDHSTIRDRLLRLAAAEEARTSRALVVRPFEQGVPA